MNTWIDWYRLLALSDHLIKTLDAAPSLEAGAPDDGASFISELSRQANLITVVIPHSDALLLKAGTVVDATLIPAPTSTKNSDKARDPEMHSSKKGNQWHMTAGHPHGWGMKVHIGADAESGLVHSVRATSGNVHDATEGNSLLHGRETVAFGDAGYQGVDKCPDARAEVSWHIAMGPGKRRARDKANQADPLIEQVEKLKAGIRAKVEHQFRVIKRQCGFLKVGYKGLKKNAAQLWTLFALSNLWMVRGQLMSTPQGAEG